MDLVEGSGDTSTDNPFAERDDDAHSAHSNKEYHADRAALAAAPAVPEEQIAGHFVYIERYKYTAKAALRGKAKVPVWKILFAGETAGTQDTVASIERDVYEKATKYHVMLGTAAFESIRWRDGEREKHDQRVRISGHVDRKVIDSCMGEVYYRGTGWCACFDGTLSDSSRCCAKRCQRTV